MLGACAIDPLPEQSFSAVVRSLTWVTLRIFASEWSKVQQIRHRMTGRSHISPFVRLAGAGVIAGLFVLTGGRAALAEVSPRMRGGKWIIFTPTFQASRTDNESPLIRPHKTNRRTKNKWFLRRLFLDKQNRQQRRIFRAKVQTSLSIPKETEEWIESSVGSLEVPPRWFRW